MLELDEWPVNCGQLGYLSNMNVCDSLSRYIPSQGWDGKLVNVIMEFER